MRGCNTSTSEQEALRGSKEGVEKSEETLHVLHIEH